MRRGFWAKNWMIGALLSLSVLLASWLGYLDGLERVVYDYSVSRFFSPAPSDRIAIIAIDEQSLRHIGPWPWPRVVHANLLNTLATGQPRVIGTTVAFPEVPPEPSVQAFDKLLEYYGDSSLASAKEELNHIRNLINESQKHTGAQASKELQQLYTDFKKSRLNSDLGNDIEELNIRLVKAKRAINGNETLAASIKLNGAMVLPLPYEPGYRSEQNDAALPIYLLEQRLPKASGNAGLHAARYAPRTAFAPQPPSARLGAAASTVAFTPLYPDQTDGPHSTSLVLRYKDDLYPSLPLALIAQYRGLKTDQISVNTHDGLMLDGKSLPTSPDLSVHAVHYPASSNAPAFEIDSFDDLLTGKVSAAKYNDRIVLIGATAAQAQPITQDAAKRFVQAPVITLAHALSSLLNHEYLITPSWGPATALSMLLLSALYLTLLYPRLSSTAGLSLSVFFILSILGLTYYLIATQAIWLNPVGPSLLLLLGSPLVSLFRSKYGEPLRSSKHTDAAENARMTGLAFQGQGQLEMALEKFRSLPLSDDAMELLYNLGLDFERQQNFKKAIEIYQYMSGHDAHFRDLQQRIIRNKAMASSGAKMTKGGTLMLQGGTEKPMLGRYEVLEELGKGAMGVVYLGQDPTISRTVAIKTLDLSTEFEDKDLADVKARFFREAETAGRLSHPHIVTIYDAGEEHNLAYIAMEYLNGEDLTVHTQIKNLLALRRSLDIVAKCADALAYAHDHGVVHRDIKPANVMYEEDTGKLKITDFGIARITDSSRTKTGMVLGTPSYMSPEQLAGKRVDGRSDLFSLGVMLFQLITGKLPFRAESMATLMYKIANEAHPPIKNLRPDVPDCVDTIINKALQKDRSKRYQTGAEIAKDIRNCMSEF